MKCASVAGMVVSFCLAGAVRGGPMMLRYDRPAATWAEEALPIGNGRLGGMVFGGVGAEHIQFNEDSLWIGDEHDTGAYQAFGDLFVELGEPGSPSAPDQQLAASYERMLDLTKAVHRVRYTRAGTTFERTCFCSYPAQVLVVHFTADIPGAYSGRLVLRDAHRSRVTASGNRITASGSLEGYTYSEGSNRGRTDIRYDIALQYEAQVLVRHTGGTLAAHDDALLFRGCDDLTVFLAAGTNYVNRRERGWTGEHPHQRVTAQLEAASARAYGDLLAEHVVDYREFFDRCSLDVGTSAEETRRLTTAARMTAYRKGAEDLELEALMFQYARYLMISSSRPGDLPANLQGLWNQSNEPPWRCDYHTDVNIQMNYWFVDAANLSECFEPLAEWVHSIRDVRKEETHATFGTRGWITHAENGIFGGSTWKWSKGDAAWVAQNLWDHYAFTQDRDYLAERAYPIMKELCAFWQDDLKECDDGSLVSPNGFSPEHGPHEDGVSFDQQLVWDLFTNTIEASATLGIDADLRVELGRLRERLLGPQIGRWGQLQEWMVDRDDPNDHHRHLSHLIAVHPGRQISPLATPELAQAARVSMNARGDGATGWSKAWKICIWARLHDGNRARKLLTEMLKGNVYDNLFDTHPPFQIDGNFGYAAGVCEMLLQSHMGVIHVLPALPDAWPSGRARGLRARGGLTVDLDWREGRLLAAVLRADADGTFTLRAPAGQRLVGPDRVTLARGEVHRAECEQQ